MKIISTAKQTQTEVVLTPSWKEELRTTAYVQIYPRVSTPEQKKNVSAEMQVDRGFALACGWTEELIIVDDRDLGVSGQLRMEDRLAFNEMNQKIANGIVKMVIAAQVDRLFRDRWGAEYAKFMEICYIYGVKVITLNHTRTAIDFIYDFSISWHVDQFRRKCEEAWRYIETQIQKMNALRAEAAKAGRWTGHNIPIGYMPDLRERIDGKKNPFYKRWITYPAHLDRLDYLYKRYKQLGGSLYDLFREVHKQEAFFPAFEEWVPDAVITHCKMLMVKFADREEVDIEELRTTGFTILSPEGLKSILMNPFNGGMLVYKGVLISAEDHDPATKLGTFLYAYNRLSPTSLDGTPNPYYEAKRKVYAKRFESKLVAALYGKLEPLDPAYRVYPRVAPTSKKPDRKPDEVRKYYEFCMADPATQQSYMIPVTELDGCFFEHLVKKLQSAKEFKNYLDYEKKEALRREAQIAQIERDLIAARAAMQRIENQAANGELTNQLLAKAANDSYGQLQQDVARLEESKVNLAATATIVHRRMGYKELMKRAGKRWRRLVTPEDLPEIVDTFAQNILWERLSQRFYALTVQWRDPDWGSEKLICFREVHPTLKWTPAEEALLREKYAAATAEELLALFPDRTPAGIRRRAHALHLTSPFLKNWAGYLDDPVRQAARWDNPWTPEEDAILKEKYPKGTAQEILQLLPGRSRHAIQTRAQKIPVQSEVKKDWRTVGNYGCSILTSADREVMQMYTIEEEDLLIPGVKLLRCSGA